MGGFLFGRIGATTIGIATAIAGGLVSGLFQGRDRQAALTYSIFVGVGVSLLGVLTRAWGAYTLTRLWLALRGRLPLCLTRFLDDAHRRGVLRQSGTTYNHITTAQPGSAARVPSDVTTSSLVPAEDGDPRPLSGVSPGWHQQMLINVRRPGSANDRGATPRHRHTAALNRRRTS